MRVLVACEESQEVCKAFRAKGHEAYSCDIIDCSGGHPEWHIKHDVLDLINGWCEFATEDGTMHRIEGKWDMIISFPPCFVAGTKILTKDGYKNIEDVKIGDYVLTHTGRYKKVLNTMIKPTTEIVKVLAESSASVYCTPNHPFYTNIVKSEYKRKTHRRTPSEHFTWLQPQEFDKYMQYTLHDNKKSYKQRVYLTSICDDLYESPTYDGMVIANHHVNTLKINNPTFWYFLGRWVGDGWFYKKKIHGVSTIQGIVLCCQLHEKDDMQKMFDELGYHTCIGEERTGIKFSIFNAELARYIKENFDEYSYGKRIPGFVTRLPQNLALEFIRGYLDTDGYIQDNRISFDTTSEDVVYGMQYMFRKYLSMPCNIKANKNRNIIEGRKVNTRTIYSCHAQKSTNHRYMKKDDYFLYPLKSFDKEQCNTLVYNLSVEDDESYVANGFIVHNCTHLAVSGAAWFEQKRADGRQRDGIEFFCQFLNADCDKIVVENPVGIISGDYVQQWFPDLAEKYGLPKKPTQIISPWMFGDNHEKHTCLWMKGVNPLVPEVTEKPELEYFEWIDSKTGRLKRQPKWYADAFKLPPAERAKVRSKTFPGIAKAMADAWC